MIASKIQKTEVTISSCVAPREEDGLLIELPISTNDKLRVLIASLDSALGERITSTQSSAWFDQDGKFVSQLNGPCSKQSWQHLSQTAIVIV